MRYRAILVSFSAAFLLNGVWASSASYAAGGNGGGDTSGQTIVANYAGTTISLTGGWDGARACLIWRTHGVVECFRTDAGMATREAQLRSDGTSAWSAPDSATTAECSSSLDLYSGSNFTGLHLALWDEGYWQELSEYGFADTTRSFIGGACGFHLADGEWGEGYWYPGNTGPYSAASDMGSWDDTVQSVYIE